MKSFTFFIILLLFYANFCIQFLDQSCIEVKYRGDATDENGEIIFTYSFVLEIIFYDEHLPNQNIVLFTGFNLTFLQESNLKFYGVSYTDKYQSCISLKKVTPYVKFSLPDQEIKFILNFAEGEEEISENDLCQSNKTYSVDTITLFINDVTFFNAENGQFFDDINNIFTNNDDVPMEEKFLNGNKSVECTNPQLIYVPDKIQEICTNFEGHVIVLNLENDDTKVGQILYSIDSVFINVSLHSTEDWYIHVLPYCMENSTECSLTLPFEDGFQYPIQLITSFGSFYIGYIIRRAGMFLKYNYIFNLMSYGGYYYSEDAFTFEDPCWNHTFSYPNFNGTFESLFCCTKFDRNPPTTPTTEATTENTTTDFSYSSSSFPVTSMPHEKNQKDSPSNKPPIAWIICGSTGGLLIVLLIILYFYRKKKQQRKALEKMTSNVGTNILQNLRPDFANFLLPKISHAATDYDEFEIEWNKLIFTTSILGAGAFGHIIQGKLINGSTKNGIYEHDFIDVAIKMPQKTASDSVCMAFLNEIKMMKKINGNKNIIKMYGYVTKGPRICLILEYCCYKDLLHYCKQLKNKDQNFDETKKQTEKEFFIFTWQISHGMHFLASKNIIHCDLAARNILIDKDKNAKISDFGLSVQLESDSVIVKDDARKLPIKWLSIETLKFQEFSLNSDIWSFGILLYEMYSFGNTPYEEIDDYADLLQHLEDGNRLKKPVICLDKIYNLMIKCWNSIPTSRPSINEIIQTFKEFLEESTEGYGYLKLFSEKNVLV